MNEILEQIKVLRDQLRAVEHRTPHSDAAAGGLQHAAEQLQVHIDILAKQAEKAKPTTPQA